MFRMRGEGVRCLGCKVEGLGVYAAEWRGLCIQATGQRD